MNVDAFDLTSRVAIITGGAGLLGVRHAEAIAQKGGIPVILDLDSDRAEREARRIAVDWGVKALGLAVDITQSEEVKRASEKVLSTFGRIEILINNAANNPTFESVTRRPNLSRLENFPMEVWDQDIAVGLTGAFLCSRTIGHEMAQAGGGVILNIASDLSIIAPDQRIYRKAGLPDDEQPVKPVTYSVVKTGIIGLTRYLSTYWADKRIRVNALSPGGVNTGQPEDFVTRLTDLIPMGRMAESDEYKGVVQFLCSDASSYMTGQNVIMDGGRTVL